MSQQSGGHKCPTPKAAPPDPNSLFLCVLCGLLGPTRESVSPKKRRACTGPPPKGLALWAARPIIIDLAPPALRYAVGRAREKVSPNLAPTNRRRGKK